MSNRWVLLCLTRVVLFLLCVSSLGRKKEDEGGGFTVPLFVKQLRFVRGSVVV